MSYDYDTNAEFTVLPESSDSAQDALALQKQEKLALALFLYLFG